MGAEKDDNIDWVSAFMLTVRPKLNEQLGEALNKEMDTGEKEFKGYLFFALGFSYLAEWRLGEVKTFWELAIREDIRFFGESDYKNHSAWKMYNAIFETGEPIIQERVGQILNELTEEIPGLRRELLYAKQRSKLTVIK